MKVALINSFVTSAERYGRDIGGISGHHAPLGLCYLAAFLEQNNIKAEVIDAEARRLRCADVISILRRMKPDAVGITSTTMAFPRVRSMAVEIKRMSASLPVIIGGHHVTSNPETVLADKCFDFGVLREGEITLHQLLKTLDAGGTVDSVKGLAYRKGGHIIKNPFRPYIKDIDSLPYPARHLLPNIERYVPPLGSYRYKPVMSMVTSRGCPYECIFCDNSVFGRQVRFNSPEYVVSEIEEIVARYGAKEICFLDDTFIVNEERVRKILSLLRSSHIRIHWTCMTRVNNLSADLLADMKDAGCWQISVGIESGNQEVLRSLKKGISLRQVRDAASWAHERGIYVKGFFMIGSPLDTTETIEQSIDFAKSIPLTDIVVTLATPVPGTELYRIATDREGLRSRDWSDFSYWKPVMRSQGLDPSALYSKQKRFYRKFYLRGSVMYRQVTKIRRFFQLKEYARHIPRCISFLQ